MTTPTPPVTPPAPEPAPAPRSRLRSRGGVIGAVVIALVIVGGVAAALIIPGGPGGRPPAPGVGLSSDLGPLRGPEGGSPRPGPPKGSGIDGWLGKDALLAGSVVSVSDGTLVVAVDGGGQRTLKVDDRTRVRGDGAAALTGLKPGERVVVRVTGTGDAATAVSVMSPQARITGTVTALTGDSATVMGIDGRPATVNIAALTSKPAVGDIVIITGTVTGGSTIKAEQVRVLPKAS
ncbi:hypothetical protein [Pseudonocardia sp. GCM10023141]|uniref:hypothetical protein n=1 Tax=Pseudonocardia sp. GCM10023141 TaxID=3252653 RepID=UPI0036187242